MKVVLLNLISLKEEEQNKEKERSYNLAFPTLDNQWHNFQLKFKGSTIDLTYSKVSKTAQLTLAIEMNKGIDLEFKHLPTDNKLPEITLASLHSNLGFKETSPNAWQMYLNEGHRHFDIRLQFLPDLQRVSFSVF